MDKRPILLSSLDIDNWSKLIRNTFPYKVSDEFADNDFITESNEISTQISIVDSTSFGSVDSIQIINDGDNYRVGNSAIFDNTDTNGSGLNVVVKSLKGKEITSLDTTIDTFNDVVLFESDKGNVSAFISTSPSLNNGDRVVISGISTTIIDFVNGSQILGIETARSIVYQEIPNSATTGIVTDIYVSKIPNQISVGSSIGIGTEKLLVLNKFENNNILRVKRGVSSGVHTVGTQLELIRNVFELHDTAKNVSFESTLNDKVFFNPHE